MRSLTFINGKRPGGTSAAPPAFAAGALWEKRQPLHREAHVCMLGDTYVETRSATPSKLTDRLSSNLNIGRPILTYVYSSRPVPKRVTQSSFHCRYAAARRKIIVI